MRPILYYTLIPGLEEVAVASTALWEPGFGAASGLKLYGALPFVGFLSEDKSRITLIHFTGIRIAPPEGVHVMLFENGEDVSQFEGKSLQGVIDSSYRGEILSITNRPASEYSIVNGAIMKNGFNVGILGGVSSEDFKNMLAAALDVFDGVKKVRPTRRPILHMAFLNYAGCNLAEMKYVSLEAEEFNEVEMFRGFWE